MNRPKTFYLSPYLGISAKPSFLGIANDGKGCIFAPENKCN